MSKEFDLLKIDIDPAILAGADKTYLDQLAGVMHAHNELSVLNRILLFSLNDTGEGELHDAAQSVQMWCVLQLLSGKLVETWKMIWKRFLRSNPQHAAIGALGDKQQESLNWLLDYFDPAKSKTNSLAIVRDKTAFHFDPLDLREAAKSSTADLATVYLAQHPANGMYYVGSALVFQTVFSGIADVAGDATGLSLSERVLMGLTITMNEANSANWHLHSVLYGILKFMMESAGIVRNSEQQERIRITNAPKAEAVGLPTFLDIGSA